MTPTSHSYPTHVTHVHTGSDLFAARRWRHVRPSRPVGVISSPHTTATSSLFTVLSWHVHHSFAVVFISLSCIRRTHEKLVSNAKMTPPTPACTMSHTATHPSAHLPPIQTRPHPHPEYPLPAPPPARPPTKRAAKKILGFRYDKAGTLHPH